MPNDKGKKSSHIFIYLRIAVVVLGVAYGVYWVSREQRWPNLTKIFLQMNLWIFVAALVIFVISQVLVGLRWWLLLRTQSVFIAFWAAVKLHFLGLFYNNFMPGAVGGDVIRAWYVTRHTDRKFEAALSVFVDRAIGLLGTLAIAVFFYTLFLRGRGVEKLSTSDSGLFQSVVEHKRILVWLVVAGAATVALLLLHPKGRPILTRVWLRICTLTARVVRKMTDSIVVYCRKPLVVLVAFALTVFLQILTIAGFWFLGANLGVDVSLIYYCVFFALVWVLGAVPVSIGGAVVIEFSLAALFVKFAGVGAEAASALALSQRAVWMLASLPGALIHLIGAHLPKALSIEDYGQS
ncbi:MAG TPA: lysylphosphatidylglycerol synthase transmembrane domain-containing protein [Sedimentisphaerales bacterium]|nr:lysylphosphatidylglycerol synthase transmembrane domain-containing protein [Sedimentisphaerales bacterium]